MNCKLFRLWNDWDYPTVQHSEKNNLHPAWDKGLIEMTISDKPNSKNQR